MFQSDQYFIVFEFIDGGVDLERFQFNSMEEALSVYNKSPYRYWSPRNR